MPESGPDPTVDFPESTADVIVFSGLDVTDDRLSYLYQFGTRLGVLRPQVMLGSGVNPLNWQYKQQHGSNISGDSSSQSSTFDWSGRTITLTAAPTISSNKLRLTYTFQQTAGSQPLGVNWTGISLSLRRGTWAGYTLATSGVVSSQTLSPKPGATASHIVSGAITAISLIGAASLQRACLIEVISGDSVYIVDHGTTLDSAASDSEEDGYGIFIGRTVSHINTVSSSIILDITLPGGTAPTASAYNVSATRTDPASGGQYTTVTWDNLVDDNSARDFTNTAPHRAGDLGRITKNGPDLYYGGKRIRLWGYNIAFTACTGCTSGQMITAAQRFSKNGMTLKLFTDPDTGEEFWSAGIIRFHHTDADTALNSGGQHTVNTTAMYNMLYFVDILAQYGIFSTIDLHSMYGKAHPENNATKANSILSGATTISGYHGLVVLNLGNARADASGYINTFMTTTSPHTGRNLAGDPAIAYVHYFNEEIAPHDTETPNNDAQGSAAEKSAINALFQAINATNFDIRDAAHLAYYVAACTGYLAWADALMATVGYTGLTTALSNFEAGISAFDSMRQGTGREKHIESRHHYWNIPWSTSPTIAHQKPPSLYIPQDDPLKLFYSENDRVDGVVPLVLDEWNNVFPWDGAGEEDLIVSAIAAIRGFGAIIKFDWAASVAYLTTTSTPVQYSISADPLRVIAGVAMRNIYGRRDLLPLAQQAEVNDSTGWVGVTQFAINPWSHQFRINSPKSKAFGGYCGAYQTLDDVRIDLLTGNRQAVYLTSKDNYPIEQAKTLIALHLTGQVRGGTVWTSPNRISYNSLGTTNIRLNQATAKVTIPVCSLTQATIFPLDVTGTREAPLSTQISNSNLVFTLDNRTNPTIAYEIDIKRLGGLPVIPFTM